MTIKNKLISSSMVLISLFIFVCTMLIIGYRDISNKADITKMLDHEALYLQMMLRGSNEIVLGEEASPTSMAIAKKGLDGFDLIHNKLSLFIENPDMLKIISDEIHPKWEEIKKGMEPILADQYLDFDEDENLLIQYGALITKTENLIDAVDLLEDNIMVILDSRSKNIQFIILLSLLTAFTGIIILLSRIYKFVTRPIAELIAISEGFNKGDMSIMMDESRRDEFGSLARQFNTSIKQLDKMTKQLNEALNKAEASNRSKSEFLANMSHEIRTPMNGIIGMSELLADTELTKEQREYINIVILSAGNLLGLINDILDFSKIEAGKLDLEFIDFNLRDSIGDTLKTIALKAHEKGLELAYDIKPDVPDALVGDPTRTCQIIMNLIGNAIKFTESGEIVVQVDVESHTVDRVSLHFAVSDTGIGIPEDKQKLIFESFSQADGSTTRQFGGTGLGLSISSKLVKLMNGKMWVESETGRGSVFHFTSLFGLQQDTNSVSVSVVPVDLYNLPVLVVDDNATNRSICKQMLTNWGMRPTVVDSGRSALEALDRARQNGDDFALIITDLNMPEMDGFTLVEQIKEGFQGKEPAIIMLTSSGQPGEGARCIDIGISAYLTKPVKQSDLLDAIETVMGKETAGVATASSLVTRHSLRENRERYNILVAEDNAVNQRLAVRILEKRGHTVAVANNGKEAVEIFEKQAFDLILMDIQMPEMSGYEATAAIREKEKDSGTHMPIIAMTAHAMKGDREKCLESGMDGYVSKPISREKLFKEIEKILDGHLKVKVTDNQDGPGMKLPHENLIDMKAAMELVDGDKELLKEMVGIFLVDCPKILTNIRNAIAEQNSEVLECEAHSLKGSVRIFSANQATETAFKLEKIGKSGELSKVEEAYKELEREIELLKPELNKLRNS